MSLFYFEALIERSKDNLSSIDKLIGSYEETLRTASKEDFHKNKDILLKPCPSDKQEFFLYLLKEYLSGKDKEYELMRDWEAGKFGRKITLNQVLHQHINKFVLILSSELNIPVYILKTTIHYLDNSYKTDKELASKDVFASWFNNLPEKDDLKDILDLVVTVVMSHRGV